MLEGIAFTLFNDNVEVVHPKWYEIMECVSA